MRIAMILSGVLGAIWVSVASACAAAEVEVGAATEVAPKVEDTKCQMWPRVAWSEGAKCWLIAWREGFPNQDEADIVCARVSADGQTMDPAGIRVCKARGNQEWPTVASDGKDFLVAWEDLRNGKDYDIYAARVSGDGKVLDPDGFLVAGEDGTNQARPCAVFVDGSYFLVWQAFVRDPFYVRDAQVTIEGTYNLFCGRVSPEGKVLAVSSDPIIRNKTCPMIEPAAAVAGKTVAVAYKGGSEEHAYNGKHVGTARVDPATLKVAGNMNFSSPPKVSDHPFCTGGRMPGLLMVDEESGLLAHKPQGRVSGNLMSLRRCGKFGRDSVVLGTPSVGGLNIIPSFAWDGCNVLLVMDWNLCPDGTNPWRDPRFRTDVDIRGWLISADGKVLSDIKNGFPISADPNITDMQGICAAGPQGTFLVVYVRLKALADTKVTARLVKVK
ncbi:MAG: hypothetical protein N3A38_08880 [Planctomycetota bacterium]|nr:hypothetical protein [Planctomycetota bacterium]